LDRIRIKTLKLADCSDDRTILQSYLLPKEREEFSLISHHLKKEEFLVSRKLIKEIVSEIVGVSISQIEVKKNSFGKPYVEELNKINSSFSLAHSHGVVAVAYGPYLNLGVDIEKVDPTRNLDSLSKRVLNSSEFSFWSGLSSQEKVAYFYKYWVLKEAYLKAVGKGFRIEMKTINSHQAGAFYFLVSENEKRAKAKIINSVPGFCLSVAYLSDS